MENNIITFVVGFLAQICFSLRTMVQWIMSEKAKTVLSPTVFWVLSIFAAYLFILYGYLRHDVTIIAGQIISYYVYLWNLKLKGIWEQLNNLSHLILLFTPPVFFLLSINNDINLNEVPNKKNEDNCNKCS